MDMLSIFLALCEGKPHHQWFPFQAALCVLLYGWPWGLETHFTEVLWAHNWNLMNILFCSNTVKFYFNDPIRSQISICHDSWAGHDICKFVNWFDYCFFFLMKEQDVFFFLKFGLQAQQGKSEGFESCDRPIVRKRPIRVKSGDVLSRVTLKFDGWLWKTIGHLSFAVSSFVQHFITISEFKLELLSRNAQFR